MESYNNFRMSLKFVLAQEGGYSDDPADPGGATMWGVTQRIYDSYRQGLGQPVQAVAALTPTEAANIYSSVFWDPAGCDSLPLPTCTVVFDSAVQHGVGRAVAWLHQATDVNDYLAIRKQFYLDIVKRNPTQQRFLADWLRRLGDLAKFVQINSQSDSQA